MQDRPGKGEVNYGEVSDHFKTRTCGLPASPREEIAKGPGILDKFFYEGRYGDHTAYAIAEVKTLSDALAMVPGFLQELTCVTKVDKFTPEEIKSLHAKAA